MRLRICEIDLEEKNKIGKKREKIYNIHLNWSIVFLVLSGSEKLISTKEKFIFGEPLLAEKSSEFFCGKLIAFQGFPRTGSWLDLAS